MKNVVIYSLFCLLAYAGISRAADNQELWKEAADYYDQGRYLSAIDDYSKLLERDYISAELYYNLGNSYFKAGQLGRAIWSYRRALLLDPGFKPARDNLQYVRSFNADQIELRKRGFVLDIWDSLTSLFSANGYLLVLMLAWWLAAAVVAFQVVRLNGSTWPYYLLIVFAAVAIFSAAAAARRISEDKLTRWGVLSGESADIREGPGPEFKKIEIAHEGLEFKILGSRENSCLIELGNGLRGWVEKKAILEI